MIKDVMKLDIQLNEELRVAGLALLKGEDINVVSDLIQSPESIQKLLSVFAPPQEVQVNNKLVVRCPHCEQFFIKELQS